MIFFRWSLLNEKRNTISNNKIERNTRNSCLLDLVSPTSFVPLLSPTPCFVFFLPSSYLIFFLLVPCSVLCLSLFCPSFLTHLLAPLRTMPLVGPFISTSHLLRPPPCLVCFLTKTSLIFLPLLSHIPRSTSFFFHYSHNRPCSL